MHHRTYDTGVLELLPQLEWAGRAEVAHAVTHLGLIGAVRRLAPGWCSGQADLKLRLLG